MKLRALTLAMLLAFVMMVGSVFAQDEEMGTIADVVVASAAEGEFTTLLAAVEAADPSVLEALSNPEAELTVFAPTDAAFAALPDFVLEYVIGNQALLTDVLLYHVIEGSVFSTDVLGLIDDMGMASVPTLLGPELTVNADLEALVVTLDQANIVLEMVDIEASNGVVHVIDAVLVPPVELPAVDPAFVEGDIVSAGSSTVGPLSQAIQQQFAAEGYAGEVSNDIIGSGAGFERFCEAGETQISNASRGIREGEIEACGQLDPPRFPLEFRVGTDAIAVTVNPSNDFATDVTLEELAAIFSTATTWADVRPEWPEEEIIRFIPGTDSGTFDFFTEEVFDEDPEPQLNANNVNPNEDDNVLLEGVANNPFAVGYFGYAYYTNNQDSLSLIGLDGIVPSNATLDVYPLARPLFIYSDAGIIAENPQVGEFISYYLSNVNELIDEVGYFPADPFTLNVAKLVILAATDSMM